MYKNRTTELIVINDNLPRGAVPGQSCRFVLLLLFFTALQSSLPAAAQSSRELDTLFFDAVYPDDTEQILTSSGARFSGNETTRPVSPSADTSQPSTVERLDNIRSYEDRINSLIEEDGTYSPQLAQEYLSLGSLYQQAGDFENAVLAYENTMHIHRVNEGLFTLAQTEAVRKLIEGNKAIKNFPEADKYHEYLYYLIAQNLDPENEELVAATLEWADWNLEAYRRMAFNQEEGLAVRGDVRSVPASMLRRRELVAVEDNQYNDILFVPRVALLNNPANARMQSYMPEQLVDPRLKIAEDLYDSLLETDSTNQQLLHKKANITHLFKTQLEEFIGSTMMGSNIIPSTNRSLRTVSVLRRGYADSRESLADVAAGLEVTDPAEAARAYINLGDWDLAFDRYRRAEETYRKAGEILRTAGYSEEDITRFITPEPALFAPEYVTYEYTRSFLGIPESADIPYKGYIDVIFSKRKSGLLRSINIISTSDNTSQLVRRKLLDLLDAAKVRPLFANGETRQQNDIKVRYYYSY